MRVLLLALLLVGCAEATQSAGTDDDADLSTEADLRLPEAPDLTGVVFDIPAGSRKVGEDCQADSDCISSLCKPVLPGGGAICVTTCKAQADCGGFINMFCEATSAGSPDGYCIPRSPAHCAGCLGNSDCGGLAERCLTGPGDIAPACHVDCAIAGAAACPEDYTCADVMDQGQARKLCRPKNQVCLDARGGYCDRIALPQPCERDNVAGVCSGERSCLAIRRYDKCSAPAPMYKTSCTQLDPAGCRLKLDPGLTSTPQNCGACGNACPGLTQTSGDALCADPAAKRCDLTCRDDNYDVNGNPADACERADGAPGHHTATSAIRLDDRSCSDLFGAKDTFRGDMFSDARTHVPAPASFSGAVGAAPDYWVVKGTGGACFNDYKVTFKTTGGGGTACYRLTFVSDKKTDATAVIGGNAQAEISGGSGSYSSDKDIFFIVEKTCGAAVKEAVTYEATYHL